MLEHYKFCLVAVGYMFLYWRHIQVYRVLESIKKALEHIFASVCILASY